ncbi:MAG TPA: GTP-binding protein [Micromonosporaceae bacterium]|jgi:hypothetical protein
MHTVNIGILGYVDAGKTSLTERVLSETGVVDRLGSVDSGTAQTGTGDIERRHESPSVDRRRAGPRRTATRSTGWGIRDSWPSAISRPPRSDGAVTFDRVGPR